jgi:hypothetical protein
MIETGGMEYWSNGVMGEWSGRVMDYCYPDYKKAIVFCSHLLIVIDVIVDTIIKSILQISITP